MKVVVEVRCMRLHLTGLACIVAVADSRGATYNKKGLDIPRLTG
jgi:hypothetical protein